MNFLRPHTAYTETAQLWLTSLQWICVKQTGWLKRLYIAWIGVWLMKGNSYCNYFFITAEFFLDLNVFYIKWNDLGIANTCMNFSLVFTYKYVRWNVLWWYRCVFSSLQRKQHDYKDLKIRTSVKIATGVKKKKNVFPKQEHNANLILLLLLYQLLTSYYRQ